MLRRVPSNPLMIAWSLNVDQTSLPTCRDPLIATESDARAFKTMIVFSLGEGPGQLFKALAVFALRDLDLLKVSLLRRVK